MSTKNFVHSGSLLFLDVLIVSISNWFYWLFVSKIVSTTQVGEVTTMISIVLLTGSIIQLGFEYPLLKLNGKSNVFSMVLLIEIISACVSLPIVYYFTNTSLSYLHDDYISLIFIMIVLSAVSFASRFSLLGISDVKSVFIIDVIGVALKFFIGYYALSIGLGTFGLMLSFLSMFVFTSAGTFLIAKKKIRFSFVTREFASKVIHDGIANAPNKFSRTIIFSLSVVLLPLFGIASHDIGVFYIALMIIMAVSGFASSLSYMVIPISSNSKKNLSYDSLRIGLSFTSPIIAVLISSPESILGLIGSDYLSGKTILSILSISLIPYVVVMNMVSEFNHLNRLRLLMIIGIVQVVTFILSVWILVPIYSTIGAALSVLISFTVCAVFSLIFSTKNILRTILSASSILIGSTVSILAFEFLKIKPVYGILLSLILTSILLLASKNISIFEIRAILQQMLKR
jgi:O-antigen/teichoic acid export membrane protein